MNGWARHEPGRLDGMRVLLVEDDFLLLMELELIVLEAGATIAGSCRTLGEGLDRAREVEITAAVLDVRLGEETVVPLARELTRRQIPFIFYTGQVKTDPLLAEWPECTIVSKPAPPAAIVAAVAALSPGHGRHL